MITESLEIKTALESYNSFEECLLSDVRLTDYGASLELLFNYIWENSQVRPDIIDRPKFIKVRAILVQELHLINLISISIIKDPQNLNWGFSEIARVELVEPSERALAHTSRTGIEHHHLAILWEGGRRIDVIFFGFEILSECAE